MGAAYRYLIVLLSVVALSVPHTGAAADAARTLEVPRVAGEPTQAAAEEKPSCSGYAPQHAYCAMTWTITGGFGIRQSWALNFVGYTRIRWETPTGYGQSTCYRLPTDGRFVCRDEKGGYFEVGQTLMVTAFTAGFGYWAVAVT